MGSQHCCLTDVAIPGDQRISPKEKLKITKYSNLRRELQKLWEVEAKIISILNGALGTMSKSLSGSLKGTGESTKIKLI